MSALDTPALRSLWGPLVGRLARSAGLSDPSLAEDAVQSAMLQAMRLAGSEARAEALTQGFAQGWGQYGHGTLQESAVLCEQPGQITTRVDTY